MEPAVFLNSKLLCLEMPIIFLGAFFSSNKQSLSQSRMVSLVTDGPSFPGLSETRPPGPCGCLRSFGPQILAQKPRAQVLVVMSHLLGGSETCQLTLALLPQTWSLPSPHTLPA